MAKAKVTVDSFISSVIETREKKGGHPYRTSEHRDHTFGIDIPNLPMQWLLGGINKLPLGRILGFSGEYGSFKSSLAAEMGGWFTRSNGVFVDIDTEGKKSATTYESIYFDRPEDEQARLMMEEADSPEEWQRIVTTWLARIRTDEALTLGKGDRIPMLINIDSIVGKSTESDQEKVQQEGHAAERGFAIINNMIKKFFESLPMAGSTCTLAYVTHMKEEMADASQGRGMQGKKKKELGGTSPGFFATTIIRTRKGKVIDYIDADGVSVNGYMVTLHAHKVSTGPNNRKIDVPYVWRYIDDDEHPDGFRQEAWFDWNYALGLLLHRIMFNRDRFKASEYPGLQDYLSPNKSGCKSDASPAFQQLKKLNEGSPLISKEEISAIEFGRKVHEDPAIYRRIQKFLRINLYPDVQEVEFLSYSLSRAAIAAKKKAEEAKAKKAKAAGQAKPK